MFGIEGKVSVNDFAVRLTHPQGTSGTIPSATRPAIQPIVPYRFTHNERCGSAA